VIDFFLQYEGKVERPIGALETWDAPGRPPYVPDPAGVAAAPEAA